jgi:hypothetical protein
MAIKRIIDGKTYNTETATEIAAWTESPDEYPLTIGERLYRNRYGAFFIHGYQTDGPDGPEEDITPLTPEEAKAWLVKHRSYDVDLIESVFGKIPEAGSGESKLTLRVPDILRDRLAAAAKANGQSLNAWMVRCLETCAASEKSEPSKPRQKIRFV